VILELDPRYQTEPSVLKMLYVRSSTGALVPLDSLAKLTYGSVRSQSATLASCHL